jgi:4-diphosphocytidyl-2-C-methyl-D-erythritol kinase
VIWGPKIFTVETIFANAKVNLSLAVTGRRSDGYHNLVALNVPVSLCDKITIGEAERDILAADDESLLPGNIVGKVIAHMKRYVDKNFYIKLEKNIPLMSGFGGGSSDAAAVLKFLNGHYCLNFDEKALREIALLFGADCPFFIKNKPAIVGGLGEKLAALGDAFCANLAKYSIILFKPNVGISTGEAYQKLQTRPELYVPENRAVDLIGKLVSSVNNFEPNLPLFNTFSQIAFDECSGLALLRKHLPCPMALSGSGSGCFCIFQDAGLESEIVRTVKAVLGRNAFVKKCAVIRSR